MSQACRTIYESFIHLSSVTNYTNLIKCQMTKTMHVKFLYRPTLKCSHLTCKTLLFIILIYPETYAVFDCFLCVIICVQPANHIRNAAILFKIITSSFKTNPFYNINCNFLANVHIILNAIFMHSINLAERCLTRCRVLLLVYRQDSFFW
jgi:hypothetical protein